MEEGRVYIVREERWHEIRPAGTDGPIVSVRVVTEDVELDAGDEERIAGMARLAVMGIRRDRRVAACPGHEWEYEYEAAYLDGKPDALCRCGARRSEVEA